ncbi:MAG: nitroreductase family protein [Clostridium sp.]|uniref:nitroreductase family protein n=1 Tax=Clostridium sp. TaxID=1506 RepID=UPI002FCC26A2
MDTINAIRTRTSYRGKYKNISVPRNDLIKIVESGLAAPSGCNKQTTSLIVIDDKDILDKIRSVIIHPIGKTAPAVICVLTQKIYAYRDKCYNIQDYSAAIENMLLACIALGYQSCWIEGHITDSDNIGKQISKILNVPDEYELICLLPIGIAAESTTNVKKKSLINRYWFNCFNQISN